MSTKVASYALLVFPFLWVAAPGQDFFYVHRNSIFVKSETLLSGIDPLNDTIDQAIVKLGPPTHVYTSRHGGPTEDRTTTFEWEASSCWMRSVIWDGPIGRRRIASIDVWGRHPAGIMGRTGRGLRLGDPVSEARRSYGLGLFFGVTASEKGGPQFDFEGCGLHAEGWLQIDLDGSQRVTHMGTARPRGLCF